MEFIALELVDQRRMHWYLALAGLTEVQHYLLHLMLITIIEVAGIICTFSQLEFLTQMKKLVETKNNVRILNKPHLLAQGYNGHPNTPL